MAYRYKLYMTNPNDEKIQLSEVCSKSYPDFPILGIFDTIVETAADYGYYDSKVEIYPENETNERT